MIQPKNNVYSDIFFLSLGKLTIAMIVFKFNSEIGRILVIYYVGNVDKNEVFVQGLDFGGCIFTNNAFSILSASSVLFIELSAGN